MTRLGLAGLPRDGISAVTHLQCHYVYIIKRKLGDKIRVMGVSNRSHFVLSPISNLTTGKLGDKIRVSWFAERRYLEYKFYAFPNIVCSRLRFFESFETAFPTRLLGPFDRYLA